MRYHDLPPSASILMESTRAIGYTIESALADILDNSITAKAKNIDITFNSFCEPFISVLDDGVGMEQSVLIEAMRYGSTNPLKCRKKEDMGRYGLGMKTASLSQCRCLTVASKNNGELNACRWDLDYINKVDKWSLIFLDEKEMLKLPEINELNAMKQGTLLIWSKLDKIDTGEKDLEKALIDKTSDVHEHLGLVFHRYLSGDGVKKTRIAINKRDVEYYDPFYKSKSTKLMDDEKVMLPGRKGEIIIQAYTLPHISKLSKKDQKICGGKDGFRKMQGVYVYRNKRLLVWGTWFNLATKDDYTRLARVQVDIPNTLDEQWSLDIKKSVAQPPDGVKQILKQILDKVLEGSKRVYKVREKKDVEEGIHIWSRMVSEEGVRYVINDEYPMLCHLNEKLDNDSKKALKLFIEMIQDNLPLNILYSDIRSDEKILTDENSVRKERTCSLAKFLLKQAKELGTLESAYSKFKIMDEFKDFPVDLKKVYEEVKSE